MSERYETTPVGLIPQLGEQHRQRGHGRPHTPQHGDGGGPEQASPHAGVEAGDAASFLGIPEEMLTPEVQRAVTGLLQEIEKLRAEAEIGRRHQAQLDEQASRHDLLPLLNRRGLARGLNRILARPVEGMPLGTLALGHVGGLERLRLNEGFAAAAAAQAHVGRVLADGLRQSDFVAALGGGDFAAVLALTEPDDAAGKLAELAEAVNRPSFVWRGREIVLILHWGTAALAADSSLDGLLAAADAVRR